MRRILSEARISIFGWAWIAALAYVVTGGLIALVGHLIGAIGPYCADPNDIRSVEIYGACEPCTLYFSVFGVLNLSACSDPVVSFLLNTFVATPHVVIVILSLLINALPWLLRAALLVGSLILLVYALIRELGKKRTAAGIHRALIFAVLALTSAHAMAL